MFWISSGKDLALWIEFIALANSVSNRRKSRAGKSLELHLEHHLIEHGLRHFATQAITEGNKKPDFLFPSAGAYHDTEFPVEICACWQSRLPVRIAGVRY